MGRGFLGFWTKTQKERQWVEMPALLTVPQKGLKLPAKNAVSLHIFRYYRSARFDQNPGNPLKIYNLLAQLISKEQLISSAYFERTT